MDKESMGTFKYILTAINEVGISTVLLILFLLMYMGIVPSGMSSTLDALAKEHTENVEISVRQFGGLHTLLVEQQEAQMHMLRQICLNTARTEAQQIECNR